MLHPNEKTVVISPYNSTALQRPIYSAPRDCEVHIIRLTTCTTQASSNLDIPFFRAVATLAMRKHLI